LGEMNGLMKRIIDDCARGIVKHTFIGPYVSFVGLRSIKKELILARRHLKAVKKARRIYQKNSSIKLDLGSGNKTQKGWIGVDLHAPGVDLHLDLRNPLPFPDLSVDCIYASHFLEHFSYPEPLKNILKECFRVLKLEGTFSAAVPDFGRAFLNYSEGEYLFYEKKFWGDPQPNWCKSPMDELNWLIYMGGAHKCMFDKKNLINIVEEAGFSEVRLREFDKMLDNEARRHQSIYVEARKAKIKSFLQSQKDLCLNNDVNSYDDLWGDAAFTQRYAEPNRFKLWRYVAQLSNHKSGSLLDIGCGGGHFLEFISKKPGIRGDSLYGIDYSRKAIEQARQRVPEAHFLENDAGCLNFPSGQFNSVICCEVLEHVTNPQQVLSEAYRVLADEGKLIITIPDGSKDTFEGHVNFWNEEQFRKFCNIYPITRSETINNGAALLFIIEKLK